MSPHNRWMIDGGEDGDDDCRNGGLTTSSYHPVAAVGCCKWVGSWRRSHCQNPCLRPCPMSLQVSGELVVTGKEELDWVIKGIF